MSMRAKDTNTRHAPYVLEKLRSEQDRSVTVRRFDPSIVNRVGTAISVTVKL